MSEKRIVYLCPTLLHLMNCIVTQMTVNKGFPADIVFEDTTDFSDISRRLMKHRVFENCYQFAFLESKERYRNLSLEERRKVEHQPSLEYEIPRFPHEYTDLCTNIDSYAPKFFYYGLLEQGMRPAVHFVSEGTGTYALDFANTARDGMDHVYYGERAFLKNIRNLYVYKPELYTGGSTLVNPIELPSYATLPSHVHEVVSDVFGTTKPVTEKLIFFEGVFWGDGHLVDEMELFLAIADHVGKENIIVKRHPRNTVDRFTPLGFKVMDNQTVPWEVMIKDMDFSNKVLVSVASFTCFSAMEMYGKTSLSILLQNIMRGRVHFLADPGYQRFFKKAEKLFNNKEIVSWSPESLYELNLVLDVVGEKIGGWH